MKSRIAGVIGVLFAVLFAPGAAHAAGLPCKLDDRDWAALASARKTRCPGCLITPSTVASLSASEGADLCATRRLADDLASMDADAVTDAHDLKDVPSSMSFYMTDAEHEKYSTLFYLFIEKAVGCDQEHWKTFTYPDLGLSFSAPDLDAPVRADREVESPCDGTKVTLIYTSVMKIHLLVTVLDMPAACSVDLKPENLDQFIIGAVLGTPDGKLVSAKPITVSGLPGRAVEVESQGSLIRSRFLLANHRIYAVVTTDKGEGAHPAQIIRRFEESLQVAQPNV